jgi:hypothetical protein
MFDEHNTKDWQQSDNGVFLLQETTDLPRGGDRPLCENKFSITVASKSRSDHAGEIEIAKRIADALNGERWQDEPTLGKWWVAIHPSARKRLLSDEWVRPATVTGNLAEMRGFRFPLDHEIFKGARWLKRETPADPFAGGG